MDGWMDGRAKLRIAYSNKKCMYFFNWIICQSLYGTGVMFWPVLRVNFLNTTDSKDCFLSHTVCLSAIITNYQVLKVCKNGGRWFWIFLSNPKRQFSNVNGLGVRGTLGMLTYQKNVFWVNRLLGFLTKKPVNQKTCFPIFTCEFSLGIRGTYQKPKKL